MSGYVKRGFVVILGAVLLGVAAVASLAIGSKAIPVHEVFDVLLHPSASEASVIVWDMRLPRTLAGIEVGLALAIAGAMMQTLTRNPIAEPRILGISAGASTGVVVAIAMFGISTLAGWIWFGLLGAALAGLLVFGIAARSRDGAHPVNLALAGAAVDAGLGSLIYGLLSIDAATFDQFRFWVVGSLAGRTPQMALQVAPFIAVGLVLAVFVARGLDALALGDDMARGLGQSVARVRIIGGTAAVLLTGAAVALAGPIAFVGLAVPHAARALVGTGHRWVLPVSALFGVVMVLSADILGRVLFPPGEVPAGVITALVGAPVLLWTVLRSGK